KRAASNAKKARFSQRGAARPCFAANSLARMPCLSIPAVSPAAAQTDARQFSNDNDLNGVGPVDATSEAFASHALDSSVSPTSAYANATPPAAANSRVPSPIVWAALKASIPFLIAASASPLALE